MLITWDDNKNAENLKKHKIDFQTAQNVFSDPNIIILTVNTAIMKTVTRL